jgi:voltage-gated potassium channel
MTRESSTALPRQRWRLLLNLVRTLEPLMAMLGLIWLILLIIELTRPATPGLTMASRAIWTVFVVDFLLEFAVAPRKGAYLRRH